MKKTLRMSLVALVAATVAVGCADSTTGANNSNRNGNFNSDCEESNASGLYLLTIGPPTATVTPGGSVKLRAMVVHLAEDEATRGVAEGVVVNYQIISVLGDGVLSVTSASTGTDGMASTDFTATDPQTYQITASADGTCSITFTVTVNEQQRGLREVSPDPTITYVNRRISLEVQAYYPVPGFGESPLVGEQITFDLGPGGSGTSIQDTGGITVGSQVITTTNSQGIATIQLNTGSAAVLNGVVVTANLTGTAPADIQVIINDDGGGGPCTNSSDCGGGLICDNGTCITNTPGPCLDNSDCNSPYVCDTGLGQCVNGGPTGDRCGVIAAGAQCTAPQVCIAGFCQDPPGTCQHNDECPTGFLCQNGNCVPDPNNPGGPTPCLADTDCTGQLVCESGTCVDPADCTPLPSDTRLQGTWSFDSTLHLRDAIGGFMSGLLNVASVLNQLITGNFDIPGISGFVEDLVNDIIEGIVDAYVPPWAQELIGALAAINDILNDMRVLSTTNLVAQGNYEYLGSTTWDTIEFQYQGQQYSGSPCNIPQIGCVYPDDFTSREICGVFWIDQHHINNVVGGLVRWAIEVVLTGVTCSVPGWPCFYTIDEALDYLIDCDAIAFEIDNVVYNTFGIDVYDAVYNVCDNYKQDAIDTIIDALDSIETELSLMTLRGTANIISDNDMQNGRWYGTLAFGNYEGEFTATK